MFQGIRERRREGTKPGHTFTVFCAGSASNSTGKLLDLPPLRSPKVTRLPPPQGPGANEARAMLESLYEADSAAPGPELPSATEGEDEGPAER